jgi:predicted heme/steroid binding protein
VGWWWLRSPGGDRGHAAYVSYGGGVYDIGSSVSNDGGGVRPALFLNLDA